LEGEHAEESKATSRRRADRLAADAVSIARHENHQWYEPWLREPNNLVLNEAVGASVSTVGMEFSELRRQVVALLLDHYRSEQYKLRQRAIKEGSQHG